MHAKAAGPTLIEHIGFTFPTSTSPDSTRIQHNIARSADQIYHEQMNQREELAQLAATFTMEVIRICGASVGMEPEDIEEQQVQSKEEGTSTATEGETKEAEYTST